MFVLRRCAAVVRIGPSTGRRRSASSRSAAGANHAAESLLRVAKEHFHDPRGRRCRLCNEYIGSLSYGLHSQFAPHNAREGVALELLRHDAMTGTEVCDLWWGRLDASRKFRRIQHLGSELGRAGERSIGPTPGAVHSTVFARLRPRRERVRQLLRFLRDRHILRDCFSVGLGRTWEFDRLEWVGDNVIKPAFYDRAGVMFPADEGGIRGKLGMFTTMIDSNEGLARAYDFLSLRDLTGSEVVSKFKSDVVESIFGELEGFLWATTVDTGGGDHVMLHLEPVMRYMRMLVLHTKNELAHLMVMLHVEGVRAVLDEIGALENLRLTNASRKASVERAAVVAPLGLFSDPVPCPPTRQRLANTLVHRVPPLVGLGAQPTKRVTASDATVPKRLLHGAAEWLATAVLPQRPIVRYRVQQPPTRSRALAPLHPAAVARTVGKGLKEARHSIPYPRRWNVEVFRGWSRLAFPQLIPAARVRLGEPPIDGRLSSTAHEGAEHQPQVEVSWLHEFFRPETRGGLECYTWQPSLPTPQQLDGDVVLAKKQKILRWHLNTTSSWVPPRQGPCLSNHPCSSPKPAPQKHPIAEMFVRPL